MKTAQILLTALLLTSLGSLPAAASGSREWDSGLAALRNGDYSLASAAFQAVATASPKAPEGHYMLGVSLLHQKKTQDALTALRRAVDLDPQDASYAISLAQAELLNGNATDALDILSRHEVAEVDAALQSSYAQLLAKAALESPIQAATLDHLERATRSLPQAKALWLARGTVEQRLGRLSGAFTALSKAYELDRKDVEVGERAVRAAFAIAQKSQDEERRQWYAKASRLALQLDGVAPSREFQHLAVQAQLGSGDYDGARQRLAKLAAASPEDPDLDFQLASCDLAQMQGKSALGHLDAALAKGPDTELQDKIYKARGSALRQLERFSEAAQAYRQAGDTDRAEEMLKLAEIKANNEAWEKERRKCLVKQTEIEKIRQNNEILKGTPAWDEHERQIAEIMSPCQAYLNPES